MTSLDPIISLIISIIINIVVLAPALWISGRLLVGKQKAKITDAIWIVVLGTIISVIVGFLLENPLSWIGSLLGSIIMLIIILGLVKHFFDCGWIKAILIGIAALIIYIIIAAILSLLGIGILALT
jgi:hypothetical protein